mgnify:CR=1 FL=1
MFRDSIPVICYHRIDVNDSISPEVFEAHLKYFAKAKIRSIGLQEMKDHLSGQDRIKEKNLMLTFDDGYQDFYHNAFPLLKKYQIKAVVFLIADRLVSDPNRTMPNPVPSYDEMHINAQNGDLSSFLSLEQVLEMQASGLVEFGAHTKSHAVTICSPNVVSINQGQKLKWYFPDRKDIKIGSPLFELSPDLIGPRYMPNQEYIDRFKDLVSSGETDLSALQEKLSGVSIGDCETGKEWHKRLEQEIVGAKQDLELKLGCDITSFCWPWGAEGDVARQVLIESGYDLLFTLRRGANANPEHAHEIKRFSARKKGGDWLWSRLVVFNNSLFSRYYDRKNKQMPTVLPPC